MPTADDLLYSTDSAEDGNRLVISEDLRTVTVPSGQGILGAYHDDSVRRVWFDMPRECDGADLSGFSISIPYLNAAGDTNRYMVTDKQVSADMISFSWLVGRDAFVASGTVTASVCLREYADDGETVTREFNTTLFDMTVLESLEAGSQSIEPYSDAVNSLITGWNAEIAEAVSGANSSRDAASSAASSANSAAAAANSAAEAADASKRAADSAAASATVAASSATSAAGSASTAASNASAAADAANTAAVAADSAASSATDAASAANTAAVRAEGSADSADAAASSASSAASDAIAATGSANSAASSASSAASDAIAATGSANSAASAATGAASDANAAADAANAAASAANSAASGTASAVQAATDAASTANDAADRANDAADAIDSAVSGDLGPLFDNYMDGKKDVADGFVSWERHQQDLAGKLDADDALELGSTSDTAFRGDYGNQAYEHAVTNKGSAYSSGLYKITTNAEGHVTSATPVGKSDITALGIPEGDTTYQAATQSADGLMASADKRTLDGIASWKDALVEADSARY